MGFMSVNKKINGRQKDSFPQILNVRLELPCLINCLWLLSVHSFQKKKKKCNENLPSIRPSAGC